MTLPLLKVQCFSNNKPWINPEMKALPQPHHLCCKHPIFNQCQLFFPWLLSPQPSSTTSASKDSIPRPPSSNTSLSLSTLQVRNELWEIKMQKAEGPSGISSRLLRCRADQLFGIMEYMSLKLGKVPQLWKTSYMVPVPKTTHPEDLSSHRLVALTSHLIKTLKRLVLKHICPLLQSSLDLV